MPTSAPPPPAPPAPPSTTATATDAGERLEDCSRCWAGGGPPPPVLALSPQAWPHHTSRGTTQRPPTRALDPGVAQQGSEQQTKGCVPQQGVDNTAPTHPRPCSRGRAAGQRTESRPGAHIKGLPRTRALDHGVAQQAAQHLRVRALHKEPVLLQHQLDLRGWGREDEAGRGLSKGLTCVDVCQGGKGEVGRGARSGRAARRPQASPQALTAFPPGPWCPA